MSPLLRVKNWDTLYENNRTREMKNMTWVPVPNRMDGEGYSKLVKHPNAAAHLGAWLAILEIASRCSKRGTLLRDSGRPHSSESFALISRLPVSVFEEVIPRLLEVEWLEEIPHHPADSPQGPAVKPHPPAEQSQDPARNRREEKEGKEENDKKEGMDGLPYFDQFKNAYTYVHKPTNEVDWRAAAQEWVSGNMESEGEEIMTEIARAITTSWYDLARDKKYDLIPFPANWLKKRPWKRSVR